MDGSYPLKIALTHKRSTAYASLDISLMEDEWEDEYSQVVKRPDKKFLNVSLRKKMDDSIVLLARIRSRADFDALTGSQILKMIMRGTDTADDASVTDYVLPVYNEYITLCRKGTTASLFRFSLNNLIKYEPDIDSLRFKDINVAWLRKYQNWLMDAKNGNGMDVNGANVYLRNLRCIFNYALKNEYTSARYPFKDIDMSTTQPDKRMIPYEKFLEWATMPLNDHRTKYRDLFMLSFYLCGMRPVDLLNVKKSQIEDGRLVYCPEKLNGRTKLSIKIEPEAWEIIHKYEGNEHLIDVMDNNSDYRAFCKHWNISIKCVGKGWLEPKTGRNGKQYHKRKFEHIIPYITVYYARTCWATYAYNVLDMPMDTISQALGHSSGLKVTNFYVKRDNKVVDKANRDLIDRVTKDMREFAERRAAESAAE